MTSWLYFKPITSYPTIYQLITIIFITASSMLDECYTFSCLQLFLSWTTNPTPAVHLPGACFPNSLNSLNLSESLEVVMAKPGDICLLLMPHQR